MHEKCLSDSVVMMVVVVVLGQQKTVTGGAFCSIHVSTSNSMIQALGVFSHFRKMSFSKF